MEGVRNAGDIVVSSLAKDIETSPINIVWIQKESVCYCQCRLTSYLPKENESLPQRIIETRKMRLVEQDPTMKANSQTLTARTRLQMAHAYKFMLWSAKEISTIHVVKLAKPCF